MTGPTEDLLSKWGWRAVMVLVPIVAITSFIILPVVLTSNDTIGKVDRGNALAECTRKEAAKVTDANGRLFRANSARDNATNEYLQAIAEDDDVKAAEILAIAPVLRQAVSDRAAELEQANTAYQAKTTLSREDPARFIAECRTGDPS